MDFGFNDEYKMIQKMYREFADVALQTSCEKFSYNLQKRNGA